VLKRAPPQAILPLGNLSGTGPQPSRRCTASGGITSSERGELSRPSPLPKSQTPILNLSRSLRNSLKCPKPRIRRSLKIMSANIWLHLSRLVESQRKNTREVQNHRFQTTNPNWWLPTGIPPTHSRKCLISIQTSLPFMCGADSSAPYVHQLPALGADRPRALRKTFIFFVGEYIRTP
jgi:hypothetical protein